jgi:amidohydrolase
MTEPWGRDRLIEARRYLHRHPELSCQEQQTAAWIAQQLRALGLTPEVGQHGAPTGVVATIKGAHPGPTLAWRADIDALPIEEATGADYASCNAGVMHACGHDVHTTVGLGVASWLLAHRDQLHGEIRLIFQPAEEGAPGEGVVGAEAMARGGVLEGVEGVFAVHCMPDMPVGTIGYAPGPVWAGSDAWRLTIHGQQTHGAYPQNGVDPIYVAGQIIVGLQSLPGRVIDSRQCCVVSVGSVRAGDAFNVIPGQAHLVGLVRTLDEGVRARALEALERLVHNTCQAHGARAELSLSRGAHPVINDAALVEEAVAALRAVTPEGTLVRAQPQMGAEDFASFSRRCPGAYFFLGVGNPERGIVHPIHSPLFDVDEGCLPLAVESFARGLLRLGAGWSSPVA